MEQYVLVEKIGEGGYGRVYKAAKNNQIYALKLNKKKQSLKHEIEILMQLSHSQIPKLVDSFISADRSFLVIPLLRISLLHLFHLVPNYFTRHSVTAIGQSLIEILFYIHHAGFIYRDVKPENIMFGFDNQIYLIDFGMCKKYILNDLHIEEEESRVFVGTARYASVWTHRGITQSRRDDMESLGYVLLYLMNGSLPWTNGVRRTEREIGVMKQSIELDELVSQCETKSHWIAYFNHVRNLEFKERPNYKLLKHLLSKIGNNNEENKDKSIFSGLFCCVD